MSSVRIEIRGHDKPKTTTVIVQRSMDSLINAARNKLQLGNTKIAKIWNAVDKCEVTEEDLPDLKQGAVLIFSTKKDAIFDGRSSNKKTESNDPPVQKQSDKIKLVEYTDSDSEEDENNSSPMTSSDTDESEDEKPSSKETSVPCIECEDPACMRCEDCGDDFCTMCFRTIHMHGTRRYHKVRQFAEAKESLSSLLVTPTSNLICDRARYIPLRLELAERKSLRLLEGVIKSNAYTDRVDTTNHKNEQKRLFAQMKCIHSILCGLVVGRDYDKGRAITESTNFKVYEKFYRRVFEIGRRHKIMNPDRMRSEYGQLMYMLMDAETKHDDLGFSCINPIVTVKEYLTERGADKLLKDEHIVVATSEILSIGKSQYEVRHSIKQKEATVNHLARKYSNEKINEEEIKQCIYSISDNNAFLRESRDCCDIMIDYLKHYFSPTRVEDGFSLAISAGESGHRLTHNHERQFYYVLQSLTLWREILHNMFMLWYLCDVDLLQTRVNQYQLKDTGQGQHRVQQCPRVAKAMRSILHDVQVKVGGENWVGSSVVHLGDHNVPNAFMFIDKYGQISRILGPIVTTLRRVAELAENENLKTYVDDTFGGMDQLKKQILCDFFKSAFDGSGADNFFDAGSCIDGRLTSCWNWCQSITQKKFYSVFLLTGFVGFDGGFNHA
ncbi:hypothetical protein AKO1_008039 [Acrasis kona]|uniref:B box-type domain-containing protein n=1 Tax=Acrasis kona TaxID=1008807 RepID=A0AAW2YPF3_9EUKA